MFGTYDVIDQNTLGSVLNRIIPIIKKTHDPVKTFETFFSHTALTNAELCKEARLLKETAVVEVPQKKLYKKVWREYNDKNDSVCSIEAINPHSFLQRERRECLDTAIVLSCDLCYNHIEGTVVFSNCELRHKCRYHPECWKKLMIGESILCVRNITTKPHYLTSYNDTPQLNVKSSVGLKELIVPEQVMWTKEINIEEEKVIEEKIEIKEWQSSWRATDVKDIPLQAKPLVSDYIARKKRKNMEKQKKRLNLNDFHTLAKREEEEKRKQYNLKLKEDAIRRREMQQLNPNANPFVPRQWKLVPNEQLF